jgi:uncharacterized FAD-dependent dehydrogenase
MVVELVVAPDVLLDEAALRRAAVRRAGVRESDVVALVVERRAIDARRGNVRLRLRVRLRLAGEANPPAQPSGPLDLPALGEPEVVIVGAGPAGLFCAWQLARLGIGSIILDRGKPVRARRHDLAALTRRGVLDPDSNYCFGEGGAGTFSDGKLYTRSKKRGAADDVLRAFVAYGAPADIRVDARPHIGTNRLPRVIGGMRAHLESAGVVVRFGARVEGLQVQGGRVVGVRLSGGDHLSARAVVLATGHSATDVHRFVAAAGGQLTAKSFAVGVRIEHPQAWIDTQQFGAFAGHPALGAAAYRLVESVGGVGCFSFCMCPGGFICPAATEPGGQVVNGWSPHARGGKFANSGFVTEIGPAQLSAFGLDPGDVFSGVTLQRRLEAAAYTAGGGGFVGPAQRLDDLLAGRPSADLPVCSYPRGVVPARLDELLGPIAEPLQLALRAVDGRMPGFASGQALAVGVETRTSSPVRIERDRQTLQAPDLGDLYPCGEGAGFAGGIMSAALDGVAVAEAIAAGRSIA